MANKKEILTQRLSKLENHYIALKEYKKLIDQLQTKKEIFTDKEFTKLLPQEKAIFDAYLKRFSSIQDFLGAKVFGLLLEISGISHTSKISEILSLIEKEEIIDSLENWIELREIRNELEHDYPAKLNDALKDLKFCINQYERIESYYLNTINFAKKYI